MSVLAPIEALLGLGGNIGDVVENMRSALTILGETEGIKIHTVSELYKTPPWGVVDQPWFLNCCARIECELSPHKLLEKCLDTEKQLKRVRDQRWGPRTIDIDVLAFGNVQLDEDDLTIPHPRMIERPFVLVPLADVAGDVILKGRTVLDWAKANPDERMEKLGSDKPWFDVPV